MAAILEQLCKDEMSEKEFLENIRKIEDDMKSRSVTLTNLQADQNKDKKELVHLDGLWKEYQKNKKKVKKSQYIRKSIHILDEIFEMVGKGRITLENGDIINTDSIRYKLFKEKSIECVECGLEGKFFAKEKDSKESREIYHFNLYGIRDGEEVLFTRDHIKPRCHGGLDIMENLQTMCVYCNVKKGGDWVEDLTDDTD